MYWVLVPIFNKSSDKELADLAMTLLMAVLLGVDGLSQNQNYEEYVKKQRLYFHFSLSSSLSSQQSISD